MSAELLRLTRRGTPARLAENILDQADDIKFLLTVFVEKDGTISTEWSQLPNSLEALGAIEMLKAAIMAEL